MDVRAHEVLVGQVDTRGGDNPGHHQLWAPEKVLVVRAPSRTVGVDERWLPAPAGATAALRVVGRRGRDVAHVDHVQLGDVHSQLHGGGAEEDGQVTLPKAILAPLPLGGGDLGGVLVSLY